MLCIIPARADSKGLKNKNILKFNKKPLIYYTIKAALKSKKIKRVVVITDSKKIANISKKIGAEVPFLRPKKLASSSSMVIDTYSYVIERLNKGNKKKIDEFISLLPTAPLRDFKDIDNAINLFKRKKADSVISMTEANYPIHWNKLLKRDNKIYPYSKYFDAISNRQVYEKTFIPNGAIYIFNYKKLTKSRNYYFKKTYAYLMPKEKSVDIDDIFDFKLAESLYKL
jgi:N-acylneuraminate cytidylyltransferase/CMP-N,N'-diacetyllegionaminic acid synthase